MNNRQADDELEQQLEATFIWGSGTNAEDIAGNEEAYRNLKAYAVAEAKKNIQALLASEKQAAIDKAVAAEVMTIRQEAFDNWIQDGQAEGELAFFIRIALERRIAALQSKQEPKQ